MSEDPVRIHPKSIGVSSLRLGPFYTVVSVELGNTTTKCVIVSTNLKTAEIYEIIKEVRLTRDVRAPEKGESVFGKTVFGIELTRESVAEFVSEIVQAAVGRAKLDIAKDIHFVVRSTGVSAGFASPDEVGELVKALADGCLLAGVPPRKMTASMSPGDLPPGLREFTWLKKVYFDGAIASVKPPADASVVANEMEGELVTAGIKGAVKGTGIDIRNPLVSLDFGTTLAGRVTNDDYPYARTVGSFAGLAGAIPDAMACGSGHVDEVYGCFLDLPDSGKQHVSVDLSWLESARRIIRVKEVPKGASKFGTVPVNPEAARSSDLLLIGVDAGENGSALPELERLGKELVDAGGVDHLVAAIDGIQADIVQRIIEIVDGRGLVLKETSLGLTGRAILGGRKPEILSANLCLADGTRWLKDHQMVFVEEGLAMGAAVAARCMNSMGTRHSPMGGRKGDKCIMPERMKLQRG
jgi:putative methanogenesis marker protein 14